MQKLELYAIHADGRKLFYPQWDSDGEITNTKKPTAAVTTDQDGVTFPAGSTWIRKPRGSGLEAGWKFADQGKKSKNQVFATKVLTDRTMCQDPILTR